MRFTVINCKWETHVSELLPYVRFTIINQRGRNTWFQIVSECAVYRNKLKLRNRCCQNVSECAVELVRTLEFLFHWLKTSLTFSACGSGIGTIFTLFKKKPIVTKILELWIKFEKIEKFLAFGLSAINQKHFLNFWVFYI